PRALIGSAVGITLAYTLIALATGAIVPHDKLLAAVGSFANPFQYLPIFAAISASFLAIAAFVSMVGATNACIMVQPRMQYAIARDGLFFKVFGHIHPKYATPDFSILLQSGLAIFLIFVGNIEALLGYFTLSYLLQNALVYGALFKLRANADYQPSYRAPAWRLMTVLAVLIQLYLAYGTFIAYPTGGVLTAALIIGSGLPIYYYFKSRA
ncbi:MAG: amino acid permease, partial [bacterium]|nr:amino acid permease [bacterium]